MPPTNGTDWSSFGQHTSALYPEQINNLKKLTRSHLLAGNNEQKARFIKVAYVDHYDEPSRSGTDDYKKTPRAVLWEAHPSVLGLDLGRNRHMTDINALKKSLRDVSLPPALSHLQTEFYFASTQLRNRGLHANYENLRPYLIFYCDKIYAMPLPQSNNETWQKYKDYFKSTQSMILGNPTLYVELCRKLKGLFTGLEQEPLVDDIYRYLVLLRSLPETLAYSANGHIAAAESVRELLALLYLLDGKESKHEYIVNIYEEVIYNVINALEWLAYLVPKMYEVKTQNPPIYEELVEYLEKYIGDSRQKLAIRLEAAWALGWASVSSIEVATCVHRGENSPKSRIHRLNSNVLRQVAGIAYLRGSFTLVSFGPARATPGAEKMIPPGGYLHSEQSFQGNQAIYHEFARQAASDVVYHELAQLVRGNIPFFSVLMAVAAFWLGTNTFVATLLLQSNHLALVAGLSIPPTLVLLITSVLLTIQLGREYWRRIIIIWTMCLILFISPWLEVISQQRFLLIVSAFVALLGASIGPLSAWITLITGIPAILAMLNRLKTKVQQRKNSS